MMEFESLHFLENSLWKSPWTCGKTEYAMDETLVPLLRIYKCNDYVWIIQKNTWPTKHKEIYFVYYLRCDPFFTSFRAPFTAGPVGRNSLNTHPATFRYT
jgi:hypothetical protein